MASNLVLHVAAETTMAFSMTDPAKYFTNNLVNGITLLEAMRAYGCNRFIFSSTAATFGEPVYTPMDEAHPQQPINAYGESRREYVSMNPEGTSRKMSKEEFIQKLDNLELSPDKAIAKLAEQLHTYEKKYNLRSEIFYKLIVGTPAEDTPDFIAWAMCYRTYFRTLRSKLSIEEVSTGAV